MLAAAHQQIQEEVRRGRKKHIYDVYTANVYVYDEIYVVRGRDPIACNMYAAAA